MRKQLLALVAVLLMTFAGLPLPVSSQSNISYVVGEREAQQFAYGWGAMPGAYLAMGNSGTGTQTVVACPAVRTTGDGHVVNLFSSAPATPVTFDVGTPSSETVTPTSVSLVSPPSGTDASQQCAAITGSFSFAHYQSQNVNQVRSGTYGLQESVNDAGPRGGAVSVDATWGGTSNMIYAATAYAKVTIVDKRDGTPRYWNVRAQTTTVLATATALTGQAACDATHIFCSDATATGSASWGGTVHGCITYVDILGNESPVCSSDSSFTSVASKAIDIWLGTGPAASTGAVGWKPYLSVSAGSYALAYSVPLLTQPTSLQGGPVSSGVCTLTQLETVTPACAITNATYGQVGSGAQFSGYPVVTSQLAPEAASASAATYNANGGGHTINGYVPGSGVGIPEVGTPLPPFPITTAMQSTIPAVAGTIPLPPNFMNYVGRGIRVCGFLYKTSTTADTISSVQLWWDAEGSNVSAGTPVQLTNIQLTSTLTAAPVYQFCQDIYTSVASATATGGTITPGQGFMTESQVAAGTIHFAGPNILFAPVGSLNLAMNGRLEVIYNHTTGTDGTGVILQGATVAPIT